MLMSKAAAIGICNALTSENRMFHDIDKEIKRLGNKYSYRVGRINAGLNMFTATEEDLAKVKPIELVDENGDSVKEFELWDHMLEYLKNIPTEGEI